MNTKKYLSDLELLMNYDTTMECRKWANELPELKFDPEWKVKVIPPFGGATIRFVVSNGKKSVSVYLDCYGNLGAMTEPYWEIYPNKEGTNERYWLYETDELLDGIRESLR